MSEDVISILYLKFSSFSEISGKDVPVLSIQQSCELGATMPNTKPEEQKHVKAKS